MPFWSLTHDPSNYSRLSCEIQFIRSMGYYLIQIYVPASLIVCISWVSFWLNRGATPARVNLGVVTVLTMTTLMSSTNAALPKVSYIKSIDVFLGTSFFLVFAALVGKSNVSSSTTTPHHPPTKRLVSSHLISSCHPSVSIPSIPLKHHFSIPPRMKNSHLAYMVQFNNE
ncbi:unnamed protein product [Bemisia tabaci]|uniref:Neurotransmitter-gated ion-channel transmembrane domain-containing protein n=1 Tax=Bemisia tabaci TaxID=7038 RepID=A0A9N9ZZR5_BEMTA|nr:unnamed protein product [Bemisia tabaci]